MGGGELHLLVALRNVFLASVHVSFPCILQLPGSAQVLCCWNEDSSGSSEAVSEHCRLNLLHVQGLAGAVGSV